MLWLGIDVGGTFTDVVLYDEDRGALTLGKSPTNPLDPTTGILDALTPLAVDLRTTSRIVHGTTIGTNAILERAGARVWMLTTRGFRDTLEIARTNRTVLYDIRALKPASPVPRPRVVEVDERVLADGTVRQDVARWRPARRARANLRRRRWRGRGRPRGRLPAQLREPDSRATSRSNGSPKCCRAGSSARRPRSCRR